MAKMEQDMSISSISDTIISEGDQTPIMKRKRGRPPGSKNRTKEQILNSPSGKKVFGVVDPETGQFIRRGRGRPRKDAIPILIGQGKTISSPSHKGKGGGGHVASTMKGNSINRSQTLSKESTAVGHKNRIRLADVKRMLSSPHIVQSSNSSKQNSTLPCVRPKQWICSLCGFPNNYSVLGTLYGPFHYLDGHFVKSNQQQQQSTNRRQESASANSNQIATDNSKTNVSLLSDKNREEIWVHEDCVVWSPAVYLLGDTVVGLADAVKIGRTNKCSVCGTFGGTIGCLYKGCNRKYHYLCSKQSDCLLDEDNFTVVCSKHKDCKQNIEALSPDAIAWKKAFLKNKKSRKAKG